MFVYKITNNVNDKVYIGQSIRPIEDRFKRHLCDAQNGKLNTHFARAIRKYGRDAFRIECIDTASTQDELNMKEQYWIRAYDSVTNGYNETDALSKCGGNTYQSKTDDEMEVISRKISQSKLGARNPRAKSVKCRNVDTGEVLYFDTVEACRAHFGEKHHRFITTRVLHQTRGLYLGQWDIVYQDDSFFRTKTSD